MKYRCNNKKNKCYKDYGGRGIVVCDEWKNSYENFSTWAKNNGYSDELTIDRVDVNGNYCPENCHWSTVVEQANNKRNSTSISFNSNTKTVAEWAKQLEINYMTLYDRINYYGYSINEALTTPVGKKECMNDSGK